MQKLLMVALLWAVSSSAQTPTLPATFRLVMPQGNGAIQIDTAGWTFDIFKLVDNQKRPILQLHSEATGIIASYIIDHAPGYYQTSDACRNDVLGGIMNGPLKSATVKNKQGASRTLPSGQVLSVGSYFVERNEGMKTQEAVVFGFYAQDQTCGWVHLSKLPSKPGDDLALYAALNTFRYDPAYVPTQADYATMASLLPPTMASAYRAHGPAAPSAAATDVSPQTMQQSLDFALAEHPGFLHMDAPSFVITELSAKPNGKEYGIRAKDKLSGMEALSFLFVSDPVEPTATACRDWMLRSEEKSVSGNRKILAQREMKSDSGVALALVEYEQPKAAAPSRYVRRAFAASGDLCADIAFTYSKQVFASISDPLLATLVLDPERKPDFFGKFRYATVLYEHHAYAAAAPVFESALQVVNPVKDSMMWRRVATDQASMAYGMSGDLKHSRALNEAAITKDPEYPLYYYNLACADAEAGDAGAAQKHLEQAYARRANTLKGEGMPDASKDDSFLKLKKNKAFWAFVESLPTK